MGRILVVQTAFLGDVVLTTPMLDVLHEKYPDCEIDVVVIPSAANLLKNHPAVHEVLVYDKRGTDRGLSGIVRMHAMVRSRHYDIAVIPHRSLRSGVICCCAGIQRRISFSTSAARFLMTDVVEYRTNAHEVNRNIDLLQPLNIAVPSLPLPSLYPDSQDVEIVAKLLAGHPGVHQDRMIAFAPGSVWATKRWLAERYAELARQLISREWSVVLVGGGGDVAIGRDIETRVASSQLVNTIDTISLLQSAELIRRSKMLVSNDSAPLHMGVAMKTPVIAIFGATVPSFGFGPLGERDQIVQVSGLSCRPCAIHGGNKCPISSFDCMKRIEVDDVFQKIRPLLVNMTTSC